MKIDWKEFHRWKRLQFKEGNKIGPSVCAVCLEKMKEKHYRYNSCCGRYCAREFYN